ncbi:MAG: uridine kinase [bacterium]|nr:uridine kinase [bacterium]
MNKKPLIIGVAGGSGSGKTTITNSIVKELELLDIVMLQHDSYYKDNHHLSFEEREKINYDHPDSLETELLIHHLAELSAGREIIMPQYDFATHSRKPNGILKKPARVIIVDGILIFVESRLREMMDVRIFVNTDSDIRFIRRLKRDMRERSRTQESVVNQYLKTVKPMHIAFVQPSRRFAHIIIPEGYSRVSTNMVVNMIRHSIGKTSYGMTALEMEERSQQVSAEDE